MKQYIRCRILAALTGILGILGAWLHGYYLQGAADEGGFLIPWHPSQILFWILEAVLLLLGLMVSVKQKKENRPAPLGVQAGLLQVLLAGCVALTALRVPDGLRFVWILRALGLAAAALLLADGIFRCLSRPMGFLPHSLLCIFLLLYCVDMYSQWSNVPEMERILVPAVGMILMMPLTCEMAAWDQTRKISGRILFLSAAAGFFCLAAMGGPGLEPLHAGGAVLSFNVLLSLGKKGEKA